MQKGEVSQMDAISSFHDPLALSYEKRSNVILSRAYPGAGGGRVWLSGQVGMGLPK